MTRQFKSADLISLMYRYLPPDVTFTITPKHMDTFNEAFTHKSVGSATSYERLEFLGDSICTTILSSYIFQRYENENEGFLTRLRSYIISGKVYAEVSRQIGLASWVQLGDDAEKLRSRASTHEDVFEAFVGALYLVMGYPITELWVVQCFEEHADLSAMVRSVVNPRERLTNFCLSMFGAKPNIEVTESSVGMAHEFVAKVYHPIHGNLVSEGRATTSSKAIGNACEAGMDIIVASRAAIPAASYDAQ